VAGTLRLSKLTGVEFHAHMLRDVFAVELLQKGASLQNVATLLGNSIRIAKRHYSFLGEIDAGRT
jgi:site-specific recombinase XerD